MISAGLVHYCAWVPVQGPCFGALEIRAPSFVIFVITALLYRDLHGHVRFKGTASGTTATTYYYCYHHYYFDYYY